MKLYRNGILSHPVSEHLSILRVFRLLAAITIMWGGLAGLTFGAEGKTRLEKSEAKDYVSSFVLVIHNEDHNQEQTFRAVQGICGANSATCSRPFKEGELRKPMKGLVKIECFGRSKEDAKRKADALWKNLEKVEQQRKARELEALGEEPELNAAPTVRLNYRRKRLRIQLNPRYQLHREPSLENTTRRAQQAVGLDAE